MLVNKKKSSSNKSSLRKCSYSLCFQFITILGILIIIIYIQFDNSMLLGVSNEVKGSNKYSSELDFDDIIIMSGKIIDQSDTKLIEYVRNSGCIKKPSVEPYNLTAPNIDPSMGQSKIIMKILKNMTKGFFVECGALDGETRSNTLYLEKELGWNGLLIEADPSNFKLLNHKHRQAWSTNVCLAIHNYPHEVVFRQKFSRGKISNDIKILDSKDNDDENITKTKGHLVRVQCLPFYTLMSSMKITTIDYFSLDVEGFEFDVLKTIPFDKILIRILSVEYVHDKVPLSVIEDFMKDKGYRVETKVTVVGGWANDFIFVHESVI